MVLSWGHDGVQQLSKVRNEFVFSGPQLQIIAMLKHSFLWLGNTMKVIRPFRSTASKIYIQTYHDHVFSPAITFNRTNEYSCYQGLWRPWELLWRCELTHSFTHGAESFLRSRQLCNYSRTSQHFMEPEGPLPCSQEPFTVPYPEPDPSSPSDPILSL
jgi:hypothetical protein